MAGDSSSVQIPDDSGEAPISLRRKLTDHYKRGATDGSKCTRFARALFLFQALTQIYVTLTHLVPFVFQDFDPWIQYCLKVFASYICIMSLANWLCIICYSNVYVPTKDRPGIDIHTYSAPPDRFGGNQALYGGPHPGNGHVVVDVTEKGGLPWKFCKRCDMSVPPRAHHCKFCHRCIIRRDHHCHLVGCCIGHWNQRYFVILAGYGILVGYVGALLTITYLRLHHAEGESLFNYFPPYAFVQWLYGHRDGLRVLLSFHACMLCMFGPICNIYFLSQLAIIAQGKTLHEVAKKKNVRVTSGVKDNVRLVFGEYWLVNFLFPAQLIFKQESDGLHFEGVKLGPETKPRPTERGVNKQSTD